MDAQIEPLGDGERTWIESHLRIARSFVALYTGVEPTDALPTPAALDDAWAAWLPEWERFDPNHVINAVGMVFGEYLIAALGLAWVVATDEQGTELAVHGADSAHRDRQDRRIVIAQIGDRDRPVGAKRRSSWWRDGWSVSPPASCGTGP